MNTSNWRRSGTLFSATTKRATGFVAAAMTVCISQMPPVLAQEGAPSATIMEEQSGELAGSVSVFVDGRQTTFTYYEGENGEALYQGDIIVGPMSSLRGLNDGVALQSLGRDIFFGLVRRNIETRWPDGVVRYTISPDLDDPARVFSAMAAWEEATPIRFAEISAREGNFVEFVPGRGCSSAVGMVGGRQFVRLASGCSTGNVIHEIGHVVGLHHEQAREDRSSHVIVFRDNILPGKQGNFSQDPTRFQDVGPYCHESIMHYGPYAFSRQPNVLKTIETRPPGLQIGQRSRLADCDIATVRAIYEMPIDDTVLGQFDGELELIPAGCEQQGKCYLRNDITYTDPSNVRWRAGKWVEGQPETEQTGTTDGASIPAWAQPVIGEPFNEQYLLAAVVHDHYCYKENRVRTWRQTHRMFYNALISLGVPRTKSKIMYGAVYIGGPKWRRLVPGQDCGINCIYDAVKGNPAFMASEEEVLRFRAEEYDSPEFAGQLQSLIDQIEGDPSISLVEIEQAARQLKPNDEFFNAPDAHLVTTADDPVFAQR